MIEWSPSDREENPFDPKMPCRNCVVFAVCRGRALEEGLGDLVLTGLAQECRLLLKFIKPMLNYKGERLKEVWAYYRDPSEGENHGEMPM